ncbi:polyprotein of EF-Ts, chloroplastic [Tanacetum coccineum]|uniref:Polyprotein of EF-Ts, chloroplastic n=1 Tax=Tanacetum coccineum TaxID=301880 RepID=A0ABQ4WM59_9ASTR
MGNGRKRARNVSEKRETFHVKWKRQVSGGDKDSDKATDGSGPRRNEGRKTTKFVKGQDLDGTVKNLTRSGAFINLPEGEEGFMPQSEEADEGFRSLMGDGSSLEVGQEVKVRVLKIARGQVTLKIKKDEDAKAFDSKLQGEAFTATNPFLLVFRQNKDIASFLDEREKHKETTVDEKVEAEAEISAEAETQASVDETEVASPEPEEVEKVEPISDEELKPEETSSITGCSEQVDAPVVEENVVKGLNSCSLVTRGDKIVTSEEKVEVPEETSKEQVEVPEVTSSVASTSKQVDLPATEDKDVKVEPISDENGSIASEEQVDVTEELSSVTNSVDQVVEEIVVAVHQMKKRSVFPFNGPLVVEVMVELVIAAMVIEVMAAETIMTGALGIVAAGLTQYRAYSTNEVMVLLQQGNRYRTTKLTRANETSSRSHAILQVGL